MWENVIFSLLTLLALLPLLPRAGGPLLSSIQRKYFPPLPPTVSHILEQPRITPAVGGRERNKRWWWALAKHN